MTSVVVTADDFGLCAEIDEAICLLHDRGIVGRTSLLVNMPRFDASVDALRSRPSLEVAVHLNLTDGAPVLAASEVPTLVDRGGSFRGGRHYGIAAAIAGGRMRRDEIHREWRAQIARAKAAGIVVHELNSHGHLHLLPQLHGVVIDLLREFAIPRVRLVRSREWPKGVVLHVFSRRLQRELTRRGVAASGPDRTFGLRRSGGVDARLSLRGLARGDETVEVIVHPSRGGNEYHRRWGYAGDDVLDWLLAEGPAEAGHYKEGPPEGGHYTGPAKAGHYKEGPPEGGHYEEGPAKGGHYNGHHGESVSVIVPTYREAANIPTLVRRVKAVAETTPLRLELLVVDDHSDDGIVEAVEALREDAWVTLITRDGERSLSRAVLDGFRHARGERCVVMDGDLSHPPEKIPALLAALDEPGVDFAIGSRYVAGGTTDSAWPLLRRVNSLLGRLMARPLGIAVRDPASGFFAVRRSRVLAASDLNPIGYKIGLEILVKCGCRNVREVPIHFHDRLHGTTKLGLRQQLQYLEHLRRLWRYRHRAHPPRTAGRTAGDLR